MRSPTSAGAGPDFINETSVELLVAADRPGKVPRVEKGVSDAHPEELRAGNVTHDRVHHRAVERARSGES